MRSVEDKAEQNQKHRPGDIDTANTTGRHTDRGGNGRVAGAERPQAPAPVSGHVSVAVGTGDARPQTEAASWWTLCLGGETLLSRGDVIGKVLKALPFKFAGGNACVSGPWGVLQGHTW